jgi:KUP system potassium uptake protein
VSVARRSTLATTITALGVVYGDIGTSPLYALRECFFGSHAVPPTHDNVLGVLSLVLYSLIVVISIKYIAIVMRADNQGEGGILALTALLPAPRDTQQGGSDWLNLTRPLLVGLGIFGAALLYGDGMITPAISILGAIEGLEAVTPLFSPWVVPISVAILIVLFVIQRYGTHRVGGGFGPVMLIWFVAIAALGVSWIVREPSVLTAVDPRYAVAFFRDNGWHGFVVLGAVFLVVTGGEALYADMGHFGTRPIRLAWFALVLPSLALNYFGQGALLLRSPAVDPSRPYVFFLMAPSWGLLPLVGIATAAAVIASQALISGAFSLTRQAIQLGYVPRLDVEHTSSREMGQVYVPQVNWGLMVCTIVMVVGFGSSTNLAAAYGIAVTMTMVITAILLYVVATERWGWPVPAVLAVTAVFLGADLAFLGANVVKMAHGGWVTLVIAGGLFALMTTWKTGRRVVAERLTARAFPLEDFVAGVAASPPRRVPGTAVFMTGQPSGTPPALAHNLRYNKILHEHVIVLNVATARVPHVAGKDRLSIVSLERGVYHVGVRYGFMEDPDVPSALRQAHSRGVPIDFDDITYFLGRETIILSAKHGMARWRERLFVLMARNAVRATAFYRLPPEQVVELGVQVEM